MRSPGLFLSICALSFFICSCGSGGGPPVKTSWEEENLQGKVKSIATFYFDLDSSGAVKDSALWNNPDPLIINIRYYNEKGFLTQINTGDGINTPKTKQTFTYNSSNRLTKIEYVTQVNSPADSSTYIFTYQYNRKGRLIKSIEETEYNDGSKTHKTKTVYKGVKYDGKGNILKTMVKTDDEKNDSYILNTYDEAGNRTENKIFDMKDQLRSHMIYTYNSNGDKLTEKNLMERQGNDEKVFTYDEKGNMLSVSYPVFDQGRSFLVKMEYEYVFDQQGNWTQCLQINIGRKASITKRMITYW